MGKFEREMRRLRWLHPFLWWRVCREMALENKLYEAIAETLKAYDIPDERGQEGEDEPSYAVLMAVMLVLRREKVKV